MRRRITLQTRVARNLWALSLLAIVASAQAEWKVASAESEPSRAGIEHRHVVVEDAAASQRADLDVAIFSAKSCALRVIDTPEGESLSVMMKRERCACGVNGGYFDKGVKPIGVWNIEGREYRACRP